jgi:hypothetical protein
MNIAVDLKKVVPIDNMCGEDEEETQLLSDMHVEASKYLRSFDWCEEILKSYYGIGVGGIFGVFLFKIEPKSKDVDDWIWIIVGDLPSAYITAEESPNPACALDAYIGAMSEWVDAVKNGRPVDELIPVNVPPTMEYADMLENRLNYLDTEILIDYKDDLKK